MDEHNFLSRQQAADLLGISPLTLSRWQAEGVGPPMIKIKRRIFYRLHSLTEWLEQQERKPCRS